MHNHSLAGEPRADQLQVIRSCLSQRPDGSSPTSTPSCANSSCRVPKPMCVPCFQFRAHRSKISCRRLRPLSGPSAASRAVRRHSITPPSAIPGTRGEIYVQRSRAFPARLFLPRPRRTPNNRVSLSLSKQGSRVSHSQMTSTRQPAPSRA